MERLSLTSKEYAFSQSKNKMRIWRYGWLGARYGAWAGIASGVLFSLYVALHTLLNWPPDGSVRWFLGGTFSIALLVITGGFLLGAVGGWFLGLVGSLSHHPLVWITGGILGGFMQTLFLARILSFLLRPAIAFLSAFWSLIPYALFSGFVLAAIGWGISSAIRTGRPRLPYLHYLDTDKLIREQ